MAVSEDDEGQGRERTFSRRRPKRRKGSWCGKPRAAWLGLVLVFALASLLSVRTLESAQLGHLFVATSTVSFEKTVPSVKPTAVSRRLSTNHSNSPPVPEVCTHSCVQVLRDACLTPTGALREASSNATFRPLASLVNMHMRDNPHHAVHEDLFPILFQIANGCVPKESHLFVRVNGPVDHCAARYEGVPLALFRYNLSPSHVHITKHACGLKIDLDPVETPLRCFRHLLVLMNPLRTQCIQNADARDFSGPPSDVLDPRSVDEDQEGPFQGKKGLGLRVMAVNVTKNGDKELVAVPDFHRVRAFRYLHDFLTKRYRFDGYKTKPFAPGAVPQILVIKRGAALKKRRQSNTGQMVTRLRQAFPKANVSFANIDQTWPVLDQMRIFHKADVVIGVHGGAMGGVSVMRKGAVLVTQCYGIKCQQWETSIAKVIGISVVHIDYTKVNHEDDLVVNFLVEPIIAALKKRLAPLIN